MALYPVARVSRVSWSVSVCNLLKGIGLGLEPRPLMSAFGPIKSASPPAADILDTSGNVSG